MYPILKEGVSIGTFQYKGSDTIHYYIENADGNELEGAESGYNFSWWLYYGLIVLSLALHELGHLVAGVAYGYKISDIGILLLGIIPVGAYVAHENKVDVTKAEKIQFALAGVEANLLMAGTCLLLAIQSYQWSLTLFYVANVNVMLACVNLLPTSGLDGESSLSPDV